MVPSMWSVVEEQHVPIREHVRGMLAGERGRPELPVDSPGLPVDHHDCRYVAEAEQQISIGHLRNSVGDCPYIAIVLNSRDGVLLRIQMLPAAPLPNELSIRRHLDQIRAMNLPVLLGTKAAASDLGHKVTRKRLLTNEEGVSVSQPNAVVIMVGMIHLPQNTAVPIHFQCGAALVRRLADMARVRNLTV